LDKRQENINRIQKDNVEKEESEMISQPTINEHSKILIEGKQDMSKPTYERLYTQSKKQLEKPEEIKPVQRIIKKESDRREFALYEEAKKRQDRQQVREKEANQKKKVVEKMSKDPYVQLKYIKEFNWALNSLMYINQEELLSYDKMSTVL